MRKRHMKTLIAAVTMSALLVTGCGGKDGSDSKKDSKGGSDSVKEFTAFFATSGSEINDDNEIQKIIRTYLKTYILGNLKEIDEFINGYNVPKLKQK